eukprot:TRINITY_DN240_c0_g2_i1.p1 TRINITY_DN240_c0_g2~~TRINITY_DN240_c0_g2_i1.p1  ORF type:complete len:279 (+),score=50.69 TRINITY_DN240_c0_g2_i1:34-870(+)
MKKWVAMDSNAFLELSWEQLPWLLLLALMMGFGKGGVPGSSTSSVALNAVFAPDMPGGLDLATALQVPVTAAADIVIVLRNGQHADWTAIQLLAAPTVMGLAVGSLLMGSVGKDDAKVLIGTVLLSILLLGAVQSREPGKRAPYATASWFVGLVGLTGGFATVIVNSMGPVLNVYLLAHGLEPFRFVGTRSAFFTFVNTTKILMRVWNGTLTTAMLPLCAVLSAAAVVGALLSRRLSPRLFATLEFILITGAACRLLESGLHLGVADRAAALLRGASD